MRLITKAGSDIALLGSVSNPDIEDIAEGLCRIDTFGGQGSGFSLAQHSVLVSYMTPPDKALAGLLHMAHAVYCGYLTHEQREAAAHGTGSAWVRYEANFVRSVRRAFALPSSLHASVWQAVDTAREYEIGNLFDQRTRLIYAQLGVKVRRGNPPGWPFPNLNPWQAPAARDIFIKRFRGLGG